MVYPTQLPAEDLDNLIWFEEFLAEREADQRSYAGYCLYSDEDEHN